MATLPADEDYARSVLTIFRGRRVQAKQSLKSTQVKAEFLSHNLGRAPDYDAAVEYALEQGWITLQLGLIRLTEAGFAGTLVAAVVGRGGTNGSTTAST